MVLTPQVSIETKRCIVCGEDGEVTMPRSAYSRFMHGVAIQQAWPQGTPGEREQLINGTHPECFDRLFGGEEDDN